MWRCSIGFSYLNKFATDDSTSAIASPTHWHSVTTVVSQLQLLYSLHIYWPRLVFFYILCVTHERWMDSWEVNGFICLIYYRIFTRKCNKVSTPEESWSEQSLWHSLLIHGKNKTEQLVTSSLVPRPLPDFISQPWRKIGRRPGTITTSRTGNGGLG